MRILIQQVGGVFGADRTVELDGEEVTLRERGEPRVSARVTPDERARIDRLASQVASAGEEVRRAEGDVVDAMATTIEIDDGTATRRVEIHSGEEAPDAVWDLIDVLRQACAGGDQAAPAG